VSDFLLRTARRMRESGNFAEAARMYGEVLRLEPSHFEASHALGTILYGAGRWEEAAGFLSQAIFADRQSHDAWFLHGCAMQRLGRPEDALQSFEAAAALNPSFAAALSNKGSILNALHRPAEALDAFDAALAADANSAIAHTGRGCALEALGRHVEALDAFGAALGLDPNSVEALINRGSSFAAAKRFEEAAADYEKAHALNPEIPYVMGNLLHFRLSICDWRDYAREVAAMEQAVRDRRPAVRPLVHLTVSGDPKQLLQCARTAMARDLPPATPALWRGERYSHERIRIAYVSADFREHAVARLAAGLYEAHDASRFETMGISLHPSDNSPLRARIEKAFGAMHDAGGQSDAEIAGLLRRNEIGIAVDLTGFTAGGRPGIFAHRPSPIQVNFLGHPGTMGAPFYDYIVADPVVIPREHFGHYAEKIVTLPHAYQCNDAKRVDPPYTPDRQAAGLPENSFVFCCFNNNNKIAPDVFSIWMRLLKQAPASVLWLLEDTPAAARNLKREAESSGIDARRLVFAPRANQADHIARQRLADLFLDTLPYGAHTTASDALWAGVPVLTRLGGAFAGRVAASLLTAIGLPELIAKSAEEYEALALRLSADRALLAGIKAKLRDNRGRYPLFDPNRFARNLESAYERMWERQRRGEPPAHLSITDETP
jgi:protein O-GlcNAc transferase